MSVFTFRRAPGIRWSPPRHDFYAIQEREDEREATPGASAASATSNASCGLLLPESFALRLGARHHTTPRNPVRCPLEETALRQWCVRLQNGACPNEQATEALVFLKRPR